MSGKGKKSSSSKATKQRHSISKNDNGGVGGGVGDIVDERFVAATTRPQFHKAKKGNSSSSSGSGTISKSTTSNNQRSTQLKQQADDELDRNGGLGESLTQAIRSDDRFRAALLDTDKFGCVPDRDKYGRKTKTTKKSKKKKNEEKDGDRGEDEDAKMVTNKQIEKHDFNLNVDSSNNSMEARIAYLNALSRGDISGSSSSDDSSVETGRSDDEDEDDDDDDNFSTASIHDIQGSSGIFDPSHKSTLPGDENGKDYAPEDETDEPSPYLCILNLNWEHIRATDVFAMLHSFCPPGTLKKVEVYPSDFGRQRMEKEKVEGPPSGIWKNREVEKKQRLLGFFDGGDKEEGVRGKEVEDISTDEFSEEDNSEINLDDDDDEEDDDGEDVLDLTDATSKLYAHFPPQSSVMKNSKLQHDDEDEEGFDIEKLREYEASKLRYYFAIATFSTYDAASQVYDNVDGMEMEDSAAEIDVRVLPQDQYLSTIQNRAIRDSCDRLPAKYIPPENAVATALKQSRVTCSWERGDADRERKLTRYGMGKDAWEALATGEDIKLYLATSDNSSCSSGSYDDDSNDGVEDKLKRGANEVSRNKKGSSRRKLLGLATSDSEEEIVGVGSSDDDDSDRSDSSHVTESGLKPNVTIAEMNELIHSKEVTYVPGKQSLDEKIRAKIKHVNNNNAGSVEVDDRNDELSPFQKYVQKRKEKKKERRLACKARKNNGEQFSNDGDEDNNDDMFSIDSEFGRHNNERFHPDTSSRRSKQKESGGEKSGKPTIMPEVGGRGKAASSREELELLLAGDDDEEHNKDYDMRGLTKLERHTNKKLKGRRKRQLESLAANVSGQEFRIDPSDNRFAELLDGTNDLYGIDRTHPAFRETSAMKILLQERAKRKKKNRDGCKMESGSREGTEEEKGGERLHEKTKKLGKGYDCNGATELSSLVERIQQKVSK